MTEYNQMEIDWGNPVGEGNGYAIWEMEKKAVVKYIIKKWGIPINSTVRLRLHNIDCEFEGKLKLSGLPSSFNATKPLTLTLGKMHFQSTDIEFCAVINK